MDAAEAAGGTRHDNTKFRLEQVLKFKRDSERIRLALNPIEEAQNK